MHWSELLSMNMVLKRVIRKMGDRKERVNRPNRRTRQASEDESFAIKPGGKNNEGKTPVVEVG